MTTESKPSLTRDLLFAGLIVGVAFAAKLAVRFGIFAAEDLPNRVMMAILGAVVMYYGNALPKTLTPLAALRCDDIGSVQAFQRFAGWSLTLGGLAFAIAWLALPPDAAQAVSVLALSTACLLIGIRLNWPRRTRHTAASQ